MPAEDCLLSSFFLLLALITIYGSHLLFCVQELLITAHVFTILFTFAHIFFKIIALCNQICTQLSGRHQCHWVLRGVEFCQSFWTMPWRRALFRGGGVVCLRFNPASEFCLNWTRVPKRSVWVECWCWVLVSTITKEPYVIAKAVKINIASPPRIHCQPPTSCVLFSYHSFPLPAPHSVL